MCYLKSVYFYRHHNINLRDLIDTSYKNNWVIGASNFTSNNVTYNSDMQMDVKQQASAAWYSTIIMSQVFKHWLLSVYDSILCVLGVPCMDVQNETRITI
jgi:hypothetical protein